MAKQVFLSTAEKSRIVSLLAQGKTNLEVSKLLHRDHRTVKKYTSDITKKTTRKDKGKTRKITNRDKTQLKRSMAKNPMSTSRSMRPRFTVLAGQQDVVS